MTVAAVSSAWRALPGFLLLVLLGYLTLVLVVAARQRSLIYQPSRLSAGELSVLAAGRNFLPWTNGAGQRIGWCRSATAGDARGAVLITHGNAGTAVGREYLADPLQAALSLDVYILEYPGYADRAGSPTQAGLLAAAEEGLALLPPDRAVFLVGESLGGAVAAALAGRHAARVRGVCLLVPFNNLTAAAGWHYPWLPVRWLLRDRFPADEWLRAYAGPLAVVVAGRDSVIPPHLARALFAGYSTGPKRLWEFPEQEHWEAIDQPPQFWREVGDFWREAASAPTVR